MNPHTERPGVTIWHGDCLDVLAQLPDASVDAVVTDPPYLLGFMGREWDTKAAHEHLEWHGAWARQCLRLLKPGGHLLAFGGSRTWHRLAVAVEDAGFEIRDSIAWLYGSGFPKSLDVSKAIDKAAGAEREVLGTEQNWGKSRLADGKTAFGDYAGQWDRTAPATPDAERWQGWGTALKPAHEPVVCARKPFNAVPLDWRLVASVHHALAGLLWLSLSPAKHAELLSPSSRAELGGAWCASALVSAATDTSPDGFAATGTCNSPALASTFSSIASSWSAILAALSGQTTTSTTSTASSTTTALRTLSSLLGPITSQTTMPPCGCLHGGPSSSATSAGATSSDEWAKWLHTLSASVPESATEGIALAVASALAQVAESLSADQEAVSSAAPSATTGAAASGSPAFEPIVVARRPLTGTVAANVLEHGTGALNIDGCRVGSGGHLRWERPRDMGYHGGTDHGTVAATESAVGRWPTNVVLDGAAADALDEQSGVRKSSGVYEGDGSRRSSGNVATDFGGGHRPASMYADSGGASRFFPTFRYQAKAPTRERPKVDGVAHPTVKPLELMRWLVRLVTPPNGTVLDPFAGSGATIEAALLEGFNVIGIEREADYLPLILQRLDRQPESRPTQDALDFEAAS